MVLGILGLLLGAGSSLETPPTTRYTITTLMKIARPVDVAAMNDEFQQAWKVAEDKETVTVRVVHFPFEKQQIIPNPNWRRDDAGMHEFLDPTPTCNWNASMQAQLLAALSKANVDPDKLNDEDLAKQVSKWLWQNTSFVDGMALWMVGINGSQPKVESDLRSAFEREKGNSKWTDEQCLDHTMFGRQMFDNKCHGACTSSATLQATVFRALGLPTRIVVVIPSADANDLAQLKMLSDAVHLNSARKAIRRGGSTPGFSDHMFNEVWIGRKWIRLNYDKLGQGTLDPNYCGLMTHILTFRDISEMRLPQNWGKRYAEAMEGRPLTPKLSSENPYMLLKAEDHIPEGMPNPPVGELKSLTIKGLVPSKEVPDWIKTDADLLVSVTEWMKDDDYRQLREFFQAAPMNLKLVAAGHRDVPIVLNGDNFSSGDGSFQGFAGRFGKDKPEPGVSYSLQVENRSAEYHWNVARNILWRA